MADSTLNAIQIKVRRLTRSPSTSQLSDADLDQYINTFILYDFPEQLRLFNMRTLLTFYTQPGVDVYSTNTSVVTDPLYNFQNKYIAIHPPVFLAGIQGFFTQWRDVFYGYWPQTNTILDTQLRGNNTVGPFVGVVNTNQTGAINNNPNISPFPFILQNSVNFNITDVNGTSMIMTDNPITNLIGNLTQADTPLVPPFDTIIDPNNNINYQTGAFTVTFTSNTGVGSTLWFEGILYQPGKPLAMLYYNNEFTIRPVPDKTYAISIEADVRPTELLATNQEPNLEQWWQYISYGAALKIFQDRMDTDSVNLLMPEFKMQERLVLRASIQQQANDRTVTIYTQGKNYGFGWFGPGGWPY